ncbi:MAG: hypothetical protein JEY94_08245 [Melioribacteraceae bacterium]|nr:hypothetical protein [Melioribacteraceae bacterium]
MGKRAKKRKKEEKRGKKRKKEEKINYKTQIANKKAQIPKETKIKKRNICHSEQSEESHF